MLDADITGPSIPKAFGVSECASADEEGIYPAVTESGIQIMSVNLLLEHEDDPVLWRGPIIAGAVKQFWTDVVWENVDYLFVDMPPGTGDVPLTVFQSLPVDGIVIVTSPQELVSMIVAKAVRMAEMMHVPVIGLVENYSYFRCPDCGKCHQIFGKSHLDETAQAYHLPVLARLPIDPAVAEACDAGRVESLDTTELEPALQLLPALVLNGDLADLAVRAEQHAHEHKRRFRRSLCGLYVRCAQTLRRENGAHQAHGGGDGDRHEQNGAAKPCCFLLHDFCLLR